MNSVPMKQVFCGLLVVLGMLFLGCNSSSDPAPQDELIGRWDFTQVNHKIVLKTSPSSPEGDDSVETSRDVTGKGYFVEFKEGAFSVSFPPVQAGEKVSASLASNADILAGKWAKKDTLLTLIIPSTGMSLPANDTSYYAVKTNAGKLTIVEFISSTEEIEDGITMTTDISTTYSATKK